MTTGPRPDWARRSPDGAGRQRRRIGTALAIALTAAFTGGCATREDGRGITRVGVGLWGFGDPPVNWNLDWPRREMPELAPVTYPDLAPLRAPPADLSARRTSGPIDDNRGCAQRRDLAPPKPAPTACADRRAGVDGNHSARR